MAKKVILTSEQEAYLREHINDKPRVNVAKYLGVSPQWLAKRVRKYGGEVQKRGSYDIEDIKRLYPDYWTTEIAEMLGIDESTIGKAAKRLGLKHSEECMARLTQYRSDVLNKWREGTDWKAALSKRLKAIYKAEYARAWSGMKRRTGYKLRKYPKRIYAARYFLIWKFGYKPYADDFYTLIRPDKPNRCEKRYVDKYGFKFIDKEEQE